MDDNSINACWATDTTTNNNNQLFVKHRVQHR